MRLALVFIIFLTCGIASAHEEDVPINTSAELREWCRAESEARFVGQGQTPYNWSASHFQRGNVLVAEGSWKVGRGQVSVECSVARGSRKEYATLQIE